MPTVTIHSDIDLVVLDKRETGDVREPGQIDLQILIPGPDGYGSAGMQCGFDFCPACGHHLDRAMSRRPVGDVDV